MNITYNFQDTFGISHLINNYVRKHEDVYVTLNSFFEAKLPTKMVFYVWNDLDAGKKVLHHKVGYASSRRCFTHLHRLQTVGHEMAHILSYWSWASPPAGYSRFLNEGIATYFDLEAYDKFAFARKVMQAKGIKDVLAIWKNEKKEKENVLYPIAGAFFAHLRTNSTPEQLKAAIKEQTIENLQVIYGAKFNDIVTGFNQLMGVNKF